MLLISYQVLGRLRLGTLMTGDAGVQCSPASSLGTNQLVAA